MFGPVIRVLRGCGYTDENMQASPYDWRIPPKFLEARDGYFTKLAVMIERVVTRTGKKVALLSHSMGYRVAHYFIKFVEVSPLPPPPHLLIPSLPLYLPCFFLLSQAKATHGKKWVDAHIEFLFAISPVMLGSPRSLKAALIGDKMGMDSFMTDEEVIFMARTWGSTPWLFPNGEFNEAHHASYLYSRVEGLLKMTLLSITFPEDEKYDGEFETYLTIRFAGTKLHSTARTASSGQVSVWENGEHFQLITSDPSAPTKSDVIMIDVRRRSKGLAHIFHFEIGSLAIYLNDLLTPENKFTVQTTFHLSDGSHNLLDLVNPEKKDHLPTLQLKFAWIEGSGASDRRMEGKASGPGGDVSVSVKYNGEMTDCNISEGLFSPDHKEELSNLVKEASSDAYKRLYKLTKNLRFQFEQRSLSDLIKDGARDTYSQWQEHYQKDPFYGVNNICEEMPFPKMRVVYGTHVDTEIFYFFKRKNIRKENQYDCVYELDPSGHIDGFYWYPPPPHTPPPLSHLLKIHSSPSLI